MKGYRDDWKIDIVFVIDATGSMGPIINEVKERAITLGDEIKNQLEQAGKPIEELRLRVIDFGDFATEGPDAIRASDFFTMPEDKAQFENYVRDIDYEYRGGDMPENALEALWVAMKSDWVDLSGTAHGRHIIVLITDAPPLNLMERNGAMGYVAEDYPENVADMREIWHEKTLQGALTKLSPKKKRLILFAPEGSDYAGHSWDTVADWEYTEHIVVDAARGLMGMTLNDVLAAIVRGY